MADKRIPDTVPDNVLALSFPQTAALINAGISTVRRLVDEGKLRAIDVGPKCRRIPRSEVDKFLSVGG